MMNQSANQSRDGTIRLWNGRTRSRVISLLFALAFGVSAATAMAAEIMEVRIGRHPEFTRVVFELDRAAGYRIERTESPSGAVELVVSLEATSIPRHLKSSKTLIEQVDVAPSGPRSVARIKLSKDGLKLKEMILASPPRIVLDVLSDAPVVTKVAKASKPPVVAKPAPVQPKPEPKPAPVAKPEPKPAPVARPEPKPAPEIPVEVVKHPAPVVNVKEPVAEPSADRNTDRPLPDVIAQLDQQSAQLDHEIDEANDAATEDLEAAELAALENAERAADIAPRMAPRTAPSEPIPGERRAQRGTVVTPPPARPEADSAADSQARSDANNPASRPMIAKSKKKADEGSGWMTWALVAGGVVVLLLGGLFVARSRSGGAVDYGDEDSDPGADSLSTENPFAGSDGDRTNPGESDQGTFSSLLGGATSASNPHDAEEKESESVVFGDSEEESMEVISRDAVNESLGMPPSMGALPEEFQQMMRDMNSRVQALEGRIDELVDARDRLERQVAAQTEELRVQRAAIARTQRAVRNLARPEDEEQEATEPALRDPNQPGSTS